MSGLRNWRGEIIAAPSSSKQEEVTTKEDEQQLESVSAPDPELPLSASTDKTRRRVFRKDEFGRDIEVAVEENSKSSRREKKKLKKKHKQRRHRSRSISSEKPQGMLAGSTPPPTDPYRPQNSSNILMDWMLNSWMRLVIVLNTDLDEEVEAVAVVGGASTEVGAETEVLPEVEAEREGDLEAEVMSATIDHPLNAVQPQLNANGHTVALKTAVQVQ